MNTKKRKTKRQHRKPQNNIIQKVNVYTGSGVPERQLNPKTQVRFSNFGNPYPTTLTPQFNIPNVGEQLVNAIKGLTPPIQNTQTFQPQVIQPPINNNSPINFMTYNDPYESDSVASDLTNPTMNFNPTIRTNNSNVISNSDKSNYFINEDLESQMLPFTEKSEKLEPFENKLGKVITGKALKLQQEEMKQNIEMAKMLKEDKLSESREKEEKKRNIVEGKERVSDNANKLNEYINKHNQTITKFTNKKNKTLKPINKFKENLLEYRNLLIDAIKYGNKNEIENKFYKQKLGDVKREITKNNF